MNGPKTPKKFSYTNQKGDVTSSTENATFPMNRHNKFGFAAVAQRRLKMYTLNQKSFFFLLGGRFLSKFIYLWRNTLTNQRDVTFLLFFFSFWFQS